MNGLTMKKMFSFFTISVMAISMRAAGNDIAAKLFDQSSGFRLHEGKVRKQKLIFIPEIPGAVSVAPDPGVSSGKKAKRFWSLS